MNLINRPIMVYMVAGLLSLFLSFYIASHIDVVNPDAICYLQSAQAMTQGLHIAMNLCGQAQWPFYSILIFLVAKTTHLSFTDSAYLLNSLFSLISVLTFIGIVQCCNPKRSHLLLWLGALVILLAHELNALRQDVIRDHGFIAFYLLSILFLLAYFKSQRWLYSLGWSMSLIIATLFRIEGAVFLLLLPCLCLLDNRFNLIKRILSFIKLQAITIVGFMLLAGWVFYHPSQNLSRLHELQYQLMQGWMDAFQNFLTHADLLAKNVLTGDSARDAHWVYSLTLFSWYLVQVIITLSFVYAALVVYAWCKRCLTIEKSFRYVLWGYIIVNVMVTFAFLIEQLFLSKRYLVALSLVLMIWIPFALKHLLDQWGEKKRITISVFVFIILSSLGGIIHLGYSKAYIRQAGEWLARNAPPEAKIYSNDYQVMYYSNHFGDAIFEKRKEFSDLNNIKDNRWSQFDYLALRIKKNERKENCWIYSEISPVPLKTFTNNRGDEVLIYKSSKS